MHGPTLPFTPTKTYSSISVYLKEKRKKKSLFFYLSSRSHTLPLLFFFFFCSFVFLSDFLSFSFFFFFFLNFGYMNHITSCVHLLFESLFLILIIFLIYLFIASYVNNLHYFKKNYIYIYIYIYAINILMNDHHYERSFGFLTVTFGLFIISL